MLRDPESLQSFLNSDTEDKVIISGRNYPNKMTAASKTALRDPPILEEKAYPWQRKKIGHLEAWKFEGEQ